MPKMHQSKTINDLITDLATANANKKEVKELLDNLTATEADCRQLVLDKLAEIGLKSGATTDGKYRVAKTERHTWDITNEQSVKEWLENNIGDSDSYLRLDKKMLGQLADEAIKKQVTIPGTELVTSESLTFTVAKDNE